MSIQKPLGRDRRVHTRIKIQKAVKIFFTSDGGQKTQNAYLEEINELGMSLSLSPPIALPPRIKIELPPLSTGERITLPSVVKWHSRNLSTMRFGTSFSRLNFDQTKLLSRYLSDVDDIGSKRYNRRKRDRRMDVRILRTQTHRNAQLINQVSRQLRQRVAVT